MQVQCNIEIKTYGSAGGVHMSYECEIVKCGNVAKST